jgi:hypothetical protein
MDQFRNALDECGLTDLGYSDDTFTWCNHSHCEGGYIRERLDRAVANLEWHSLFPTFEVLNEEPPIRIIDQWLSSYRVLQQCIQGARILLSLKQDD